MNLGKAFSIMIENEFIHTYNICIETYKMSVAENFEDGQF